MLRAEAVTPLHCQDVVPRPQCAFKWCPEKVWHFLRVTECQH